MAVSSGTISLFSSVAIAIVAASAAAYGLRHKDQVRNFVRQVATASTQSPGAETAGAAQSELPSADAEPAGEAGGVTLRADDRGHFETEADVNGRSVEVMVDTGATLVALTYEDAERAGIYLKTSDFTHAVSTANGKAKIAPVKIGSISIGGITVRDVSGAVSEPGKLHRTLLGMSFLGRLSRVDMRSKTLILHE
jgi:aspartyl protease family protein